MNVAIFWDIAPCSPYANRYFGGKFRLHLQGRKNQPDKKLSATYGLHGAISQNMATSIRKSFIISSLCGCTSFLYLGSETFNRYSYNENKMKPFTLLALSETDFCVIQRYLWRQHTVKRIKQKKYIYIVSVILYIYTYSICNTCTLSKFGNSTLRKYVHSFGTHFRNLVSYFAAAFRICAPTSKSPTQKDSKVRTVVL
jgi:hypothetical protein